MLRIVTAVHGSCCSDDSGERLFHCPRNNCAYPIVPVTMLDMILIIEPLIPGLRRYARGQARDVTLADDLVQDCLERAIARWHQRRPDSSIKAWLYTILHNLAIDGGRRRSRHGKSVEIDDTTQASSRRLRHRTSACAPTTFCLRSIDCLPNNAR